MASGLPSCAAIKYVGQQFGIMSDCDVENRSGFGYTCADVVRGVQSVTYDPTFETDPVFQLSQSEIYELREGIPSINISVSKALDGYATPYLYATKDARNPSLLGRAPTKCAPAIAIFPCDKDSAVGDPTSVVVWSGAQVDSVAYNFGVDNVFTEETTFRANDMIWYSQTPHLAYSGSCGCDTLAQFDNEVATISFTGCNAGNDQAPRGVVQFRENIIFAHDAPGSYDQNGALADPDTTILPPEIFGILCDGTNDNDVCIQSIAISATLNREDINCLGSRSPKNRSITLPVSVETSIEVTSDQDAVISTTSYGVCPSPTGFDDCVDDARCSNVGVNLKNRTIRVATCDGLRVYTGIRNKLSSISRNGGDTGGTNVNVTYNFQTFNTLTVIHCQDPSPSGATWWASRDQYLLDL